jgi:hypothetical protein
MPVQKGHTPVAAPTADFHLLARIYSVLSLWPICDE